MLKKIAESVFSFDIEWIPDPKSAEILLNPPLPQDPMTRRLHPLKLYGPMPEKPMIPKTSNPT
jgi:hypothetical protein